MLRRKSYNFGRAQTDSVQPFWSWRLVGGVEALTGILMCGWSTGFFFAVVGLMMAERQLLEEPEPK